MDRFDFQSNPGENKPNLLYFIKDACSFAYNQYDTFTHNIAEIIFIIDGQGNARIEDKVFALSKGDFYIINPYTIHSEFVKKDQSFNYYILGIENFSIPEGNPCLYPSRLESNDDIIIALDLMYKELKKHLEDYKGITNLLFDILIRLILREFKTKNTPAHFCTDNIVGKVQTFLDSNFAGNISSKIIAEYFNCNQNTLSRKFKQQTGMSIQQYILLKKIDLAKVMLVTDNISITELTFKCGFTDISYFIRYFKKITGVSPMNYKKQVQQSILKNKTTNNNSGND